MNEIILYSTISNQQLESFIIRQKTNLKAIFIPRNNINFKFLVPKRFVKNREISPFYIQQFYFAYPEKSKNLIPSHSDQNIKLIIKTTKDVYLIDAYEANIYLEEEKDKYNVLSEYQWLQYYLLLTKKFKNISNITPDHYLTYIQPIYLIQRWLYDGEIINY